MTKTVETIYTAIQDEIDRRSEKLSRSEYRELIEKLEAHLTTLRMGLDEEEAG